LKTLSPNLHCNEIKFIENNNKYALKKQTECLGRDDIHFKHVKPEQPTMATFIPHSHNNVTMITPNQYSTRMQNSM